MVSLVSGSSPNSSTVTPKSTQKVNPIVAKIGEKNLVFVAAFFLLSIAIGSIYGATYGLITFGGSFATVLVCKFFAKCVLKKQEILSLKPRTIPEKKDLDISKFEIDFSSHFKDEICKVKPPADRIDITKKMVRDFFNDSRNKKYYPDKAKYFGSGNMSRLVSGWQSLYFGRVGGRGLGNMGWIYLKNIVGKFIDNKRRIEKIKNENVKTAERRLYEVKMSDLFGKLYQTTKHCKSREAIVLTDLYYQYVRCDNNYLESLTFPNLIKAALYQKRKAEFNQACIFKNDRESSCTFHKYRKKMSEEFGLGKDLLAQEGGGLTNLGKFGKEEEVRTRFYKNYNAKQIVDYLYDHIKENTEKGQEGTIAERVERRKNEFNLGNSPRSKINFVAFYNWLKAHYDINNENREMITDDKNTISKEMIALFLFHEKILKPTETIKQNFINIFG